MMPNLRGIFFLAASTLLSPCAASAQARICRRARRLSKYGSTNTG